MPDDDPMVNALKSLDGAVDDALYQFYSGVSDRVVLADLLDDVEEIADYIRKVTDAREEGKTAA